MSEGIAGSLIRAIWQPHHKGFSASHWHSVTSVTDDSRRLDCTKTLLGVQFRIPGSNKRNLARFPGDFAFLLTPEEKTEVVTNCDHLRWLKFLAWQTPQPKTGRE